ncbi:MAG: hypothetical protein K1X53_16375, partial [Candidatus Sumerlaeaceae bacterium]|nr:hypothetical protein [Candidatus Sumerlaeaceae bacterium]
EQGGGDDLVNPTWDEGRLRAAASDYLNSFDTETTLSASRFLLAYQVGVLCGKNHRNDISRAALCASINEAAPDYVKEKALMELMSLDAAGSDPWIAARWCEVLQGLPTVNAYQKQWLDYRLARLHLAVGFQPEDALEMLMAIVSGSPNTPLSVQASELLNSYAATH